MPIELEGKIIGRIIRNEYFAEVKMPDELWNGIYIHTMQGLKKLSKLQDNGFEIVPDLRNEIKNTAGATAIAWIESKLNICIIPAEGVQKSLEGNRIDTSQEYRQHIARWRSAEQQCMDIERIFGNTPKDVSKKNIGYDIESVCSNGDLRYIEVKSIENGGSFSITNNEYTAAHQYGVNYFLCLLIQHEKEIEAIYIQNPLNSVHFEKRVRQWEWICDTYSGVSYRFEN